MLPADGLKSGQCCSDIYICFNPHRPLSTVRITVPIYLPLIGHQYASTAQWLLEQCTSGVVPGNSCPLSSLCQLAHPRRNKGFTESGSKFETRGTVACHIHGSSSTLADQLAVGTNV